MKERIENAIYNSCLYGRITASSRYLADSFFYSLSRRLIERWLAAARSAVGASAAASMAGRLYRTGKGNFFRLMCFIMFFYVCLSLAGSLLNIRPVGTGDAIMIAILAASLISGARLKIIRRSVFDNSVILRLLKKKV